MSVNKRLHGGDLYGNKYLGNVAVAAHVMFCRAMTILDGGQRSGSPS